MGSRPNLYEFSGALLILSGIIGLALTGVVYGLVHVLSHVNSYWLGVYLVMWIVSIGIVWRFRGYEVVPRE